MKTAIISQQNEWVALQTPYDRDFVDALKSAVAYTDRKWNATEKVWLVTEIEASKAIEIASRFFDVQDQRGKNTQQVAKMEAAAEEKALEAEIEQIKANQTYILESEERIEGIIEDLSGRISRYSFRSKSNVRYGLAQDRALLQHSLDNARIPVERLTELQVRGLVAAVRYLK